MKNELESIKGRSERSVANKRQQRLRQILELKDSERFKDPLKHSGAKPIKTGTIEEIKARKFGKGVSTNS